MRKLFLGLFVGLTLSVGAQPTKQKWSDSSSKGYRPGARILEARVATDDLGSDNTPIRVRVYLPPGYSDSQQRYPVLYVVDGQNVFDQDGSTPEWDLDGHLEDLIRGADMLPIIAVAVDTRAMRVDYLPSRETFSVRDRNWQGGKAHDMLQFLLELKRDVDHDFRTVPQDTGLMGSSLGGLFALHAGFKRPDRFQRVAALSPSLWWGRRQYRSGEPLVSDEDVSVGPRLLWLDMGDHELTDGGQAEADDNVNLATTFTDWVRQHRPPNRWFHFEVFRDDHEDDHDENSWRNRLDEILPWLYRVN